MGKVNITTKLENVNEKKFFNTECIGIKNGNKIIYNDKDITVFITLLESGVLIYRKSKDYEISILLNNNKKTKGLYKINKLGNFDLEIISKKIEIKDNNINLSYIMLIDENLPQKFNFFISYTDL